MGGGGFSNLAVRNNEWWDEALIIAALVGLTAATAGAATPAEGAVIGAGMGAEGAAAGTGAAAGGALGAEAAGTGLAAGTAAGGTGAGVGAGVGTGTVLAAEGASATPWLAGLAGAGAEGTGTVLAPTAASTAPWLAGAGAGAGAEAAPATFGTLGATGGYGVGAEPAFGTSYGPYAGGYALPETAASGVQVPAAYGGPMAGYSVPIESSGTLAVNNSAALAGNPTWYGSAWNTVQPHLTARNAMDAAMVTNTGNQLVRSFIPHAPPTPTPHAGIVGRGSGQKPTAATQLEQLMQVMADRQRKRVPIGYQGGRYS